MSPFPSISLASFKKKYPSFFDEKGNIKDKALDIIDGLVSLYLNDVKDKDTDDIKSGPAIKYEPYESREARYDYGISR